jgi:uncharacterized protein YodC (DUF2158 family)
MARFPIETKTIPFAVGDCVRLKSGGPTGRIVRTSPGGKFRVAWQMVYYANHSAEKLIPAGSPTGNTTKERGQYVNR